MKEWGVSIRRACGVLLLDTSTFHYKSRRPDQAALEKRIKDICQTRVRYGYRRVHVVLRREGWFVNAKKVRRIYNELGLQLRNSEVQAPLVQAPHRTRKRKVRAKLMRDRKEAVSPMQVWAMDFVHDQLATGRKFRILTVVDTWSKYVPAIDARYSHRGEDVVQTMETNCSQTGYPKMIRVDRGSEFISRDLDLWAYTKGVTLDFSWPGKPTE